MGPGLNVRLKGAYILHCEQVLKNDDGTVQEIHCTYYPDSKSGQDTSGVKAKGTLHWVSEKHAVGVEARLYDRLFNDPEPDGHKDREYTDFINPDSLNVLENALAEPWLASAQPNQPYQFLRKGYFCLDPDSKPGQLVFNRTVTLKDNWAKAR